MAQRTHQQELAVGVADESGREQRILLQHPRQNGQPAHARGQGGGGGDGIESELPDDGVGGVHHAPHALADDQADVPRAVLGGSKYGLLGRGAGLIGQQTRQDQHGHHHQRTDQQPG
jgi:hypothetical protein